MLIEHDITAKDGTDFYRQVASFAFENYTDHGLGAVIIRDGHFKPNPDGSINATLLYASYILDSDILPPEAIEQINLYNPETEVVLLIADLNDGSCITLRADKIGCSPLEAHTKEKGKYIPIAKGTVVRLMEPIDDIPTGYFVFMGEDKAMMQLARAGMEEDEDMVASDELHNVHIDYRDLFEVTNINIYRDDEND